jgi:hypothetical protein
MGDDEGGTGARTRNVGSSGPGGFGFCDTTAVAAKSAARNTMTRASAGCAPVGAKSSSPSSEEQLHPCAPPRAIARRRVPAAHRLPLLLSLPTPWRDRGGLYPTPFASHCRTTIAAERGELRGSLGGLCRTDAGGEALEQGKGGTIGNKDLFS